MNRKYFILKLFIIALGLLLYAISFYIIYLSMQTINIPLLILALVIIEVGTTFLALGFFILDPTNKIDLRTCPSGTRVKIFKAALFKLRGFKYDLLEMYFCGRKLSQIEFMPICSNLKKLAIRDKGMFYRIFDFSDVTDLVMDEKSDDIRCNRLCVLMTLNSPDIPRVEMNFIQKPIKKDSKNYYYIKDRVKQLFDILQKRF